MKIWISRLLVSAVFAVNLYCIIVFICYPQDFIRAYELSGVPGIAALQGLGVAFLMWNVTYPLVIVQPQKQRVVFAIVLVQQTVGLIGETVILLNLADGYRLLASNILRFIVFDAAGLVLLAVAFLLSRKTAQKTRTLE